MRLVVFFACIIGVAVLAGCSPTNSSTAATAPVNTLCPIMGHEVAANGGSTTWNGQTIGFCCEGCLPKWDKLSDEDKAAKLAAPSHSNDDHSEYES